MADTQAPFVKSILDQMATAGKPRVTTTETQYPKQSIDLAQIGLLVAMLLKPDQPSLANAAVEPTLPPNYGAPAPFSVADPAATSPMGGVGGLTPAQIADLFKNPQAPTLQGPTFG